MVVVPRRRARVSVLGKISPILRVLLVPVPPLGGQGLRLEQNGRNRNGNCQSARHDGRHLRRTGPVVPSPHQFRRRRSDAQQVQRKYTNRTIFLLSHPKKKNHLLFSVNATAASVWHRVRLKLEGRDASSAKQQLTVEQQVNQLLSLLWIPFLIYLLSFSRSTRSSRKRQTWTI